MPIELLFESMVPGFCFVHILIDLSNTTSCCTVGARTAATKHVVSRCHPIYPQPFNISQVGHYSLNLKILSQILWVMFLNTFAANWDWVWKGDTGWLTPKMCAKGHLQHFSSMCVGAEPKQRKCQECSWFCPSYSGTFAPQSYCSVVTKFS